MLAASNLAMAAGLALLGVSQSIWIMAIAWLLLGFGMGAGLYDAAFAALGRIYGEAARKPITGITLMAGFASTVGWPLTAFGLAHLGWRETCFAWAAAQLLIGLPLNLLMIPPVKGGEAKAVPVAKPHIPIDRPMVLLAITFAAAWSVTGAMAAHLPRILEAAGATPLQAVTAGALIGPAQVAARIIEAFVLSRHHPAVLDQARLHYPPARRRHHRPGRRRRGQCLRHLPRRRQRHPHHRPRHPAALDLRPRQLRLPARPDRRAGPHGAGRRPARLRTAHRPARGKVLIVSSALSLTALLALSAGMSDGRGRHPPHTQADGVSNS